MERCERMKEEELARIKKEVEKIKKLMLEQVDKHVRYLEKKFNSFSSFLEVELQIKKLTNDYGKILLEKMIPIIYGNGYYGSTVVEHDKETEKDVHYSCMLRKHTRPLKTVFGKISVTRAYYQRDEDGTSLGLLDKKLEIHKHVVSPAVRYYSNLYGITTSYREGKEIFTKSLGTNICSKDLDIFTQDKAQEVTKYFVNRIQNIKLDSNNIVEPANIDVSDNYERIVYLETDGCHVPIRRRSERRDWKECKSLLLFEIEKIEIERDGKIEIKNKLINKKYFSCVDEITYFKKQVKCELEEYCRDKKVKIVCVGDGAAWIWKMVQELIPKGKVEILDWFHVKERITLLAAELYPKEKDENTKYMFVDEMLGYFYGGKFDKGIELLEAEYANRKSRLLQAKISVDIEYFKNNKERMKYNEYKKQEFCIGSGAIESANKYVIQRRMKLPGCSWTEEKADNIAHMRGEYINENFDKWYGLKSNPMLGIT